MTPLLWWLLVCGWVYVTTQAADIALGFYDSCAVSSQQGLMCWGNNENGQLGLGTTNDANSASLVLSISNVSDVVTRTSHSCAISGGKLYCWGRNNLGQLGTGNDVDSWTPVAILADIFKQSN